MALRAAQLHATVSRGPARRRRPLAAPSAACARRRERCACGRCRRAIDRRTPPPDVASTADLGELGALRRPRFVPPLPSFVSANRLASKWRCRCTGRARGRTRAKGGRKGEATADRGRCRAERREGGVAKGAVAAGRETGGQSRDSSVRIASAGRYAQQWAKEKRADRLADDRDRYGERRDEHWEGRGGGGGRPRDGKGGAKKAGGKRGGGRQKGWGKEG